MVVQVFSCFVPSVCCSDPCGCFLWTCLVLKQSLLLSWTDKAPVRDTNNLNLSSLCATNYWLANGWWWHEQSSEGLTPELKVHEFFLAKVTRHVSLNNPTWRLLSIIQHGSFSLQPLAATFCHGWHKFVSSRKLPHCLGDKAISTGHIQGTEGPVPQPGDVCLSLRNLLDPVSKLFSHVLK